jgi:adenylosuccinate synthase
MSISSLRFDSHAICNPQPQHPFTFHNPVRSTPNVVVCAAKPVAPSSTKLTAAHHLAGRIESLSQVSGVLGSQWGDEGKGKLVDILAQHFQIVARCQVFLLFAILSLKP